MSPENNLSQPPTPPTGAVPPAYPSVPPNGYPTMPGDAAPSAGIQHGFLNGRLNRIGYLIANIYLSVFLVAVVILPTLVFKKAMSGNHLLNFIAINIELIGFIIGLPLSISFSVRRWHDMNQSGWMTLLNFVPFASFILGFIYLFVPGTKGPNMYGDIDTRPNTIAKVLIGK